MKKDAAMKTKVQVILLILILGVVNLAEASSLRVALNTLAESTVTSCTINIGETVSLGIYINADTYVKGAYAVIRYPANYISVYDIDGESIAAGVNIGEDHTTFDNIYKNTVLTDTISYWAEKSVLDTGFIGDTRIAYMVIEGVKEGDSIPFEWVMGNSAGETSQIFSFLSGANVLNAVETFYVTIIDTAAPLPPAWVKAQGLSDSVYLSWATAVDSSGIAGYNIYRATRDAALAIYATLVSDTFFYDTDVVNGVSYYYAISAVDSSANLNESDKTDSVTAPILTIAKTALSTTLKGTSSLPVPGATVLFKITVNAGGYGPSDSVVVSDKVLPVFIYADTEYVTPGWTMEFEDDTYTPDLAYNSPDFNDTASPAVKWIRWKKPYVDLGETAEFRFKYIIK